MSNIDVAQLMMTSPTGQVGQALVLVEAAILERDAAARLRQEGAVRDAERRAAAIACVGLERAVEEIDLQVAELEAQVLDVPTAAGAPVAIAETVAALDPPAQPRKSGALLAAYNYGTGHRKSFAFNRPLVDVEVNLLRLAGISEQLAGRHIASALATFDSTSWEHDLANLTLHEAVLRRIRQGRDRICEYSDRLETAEIERLRTAGSRRRMQQVVKVLGGVLIVGTNTAAGMMIGPIAAAASAMIGSAASDILDIATDDDK